MRKRNQVKGSSSSKKEYKTVKGKVFFPNVAFLT